MAVTEEECSSASSRSSSTSNHFLSKCVLRGTAVLHVLSGHFRSPSSNDLVFGKETSIELVVIDENGIVISVCEQPVFGTIKDLAVVPWNDKFAIPSPQMHGKDLLVAVSDSGKMTFLHFCNEMHRFFPLTHVQLSNPGNERHHLGRKLAVDSSGLFIATSAYEDRLALFSLSVCGGSDIIDKSNKYHSEDEANSNFARIIQRLTMSGTIWSMCFISRNFSQPSKGHHPVLAIILNSKGAITNELVLMGWSLREQCMEVIGRYVESGPLALEIVEVPRSNGYAFVFRVGDALLMDLRDASNPSCVYRTSLNFLPASVEEHNIIEDSSLINDVDDDGLFNVAACALLELGDYDPMCIDGEGGNPKFISKHVCSWSWEPENGISTSTRMIFCIDSGELFMIEITFDSEVTVNLSDCIYKAPPCKELMWVEGGFIAALVEMGDGIVLKVENGRLSYTSAIQNISPVLDISVVDYHDEKRDQMFACCGVAPEGSLRIIRNGINVEKLLKTAPIYQGITGTWTLRMRETDGCHSFLVLSFVEETRVLSVGVSFTDVTESVGFEPNVCTLACGLVGDGMLVQIHRSAVRLCLPTEVAHSEGIPLSFPVCASWCPNNLSISLGAVGNNLIIVSTSNPCFLYVLGVRKVSSYQYDYEIFQMQNLRLLNELSSISVPQKCFENKNLRSVALVDDCCANALPIGVDITNTFVIGTHQPSVEFLSFTPGEGLKIIASGAISFINTAGTSVSGCIPQDVRLVLVDRPYILCGLRNGMLLRFEWPPPSAMSSSEIGSSNKVSVSLESKRFAVGLLDETIAYHPVNLQLVASRRIGITPVFLIPLFESLDADMIALSDRPWLLQAAHHSLAYTSVSFQPSTHATAVCSADCPKGILFVSENCLHLVEMVHSKRLNVQKFQLEGTPRKVLYHSESKLLIVMRTELSDDSSSSDICCVDPLSGTVVSSHKLELGETGKTMELVRVGNEQVLLVGTSLSSGPAIMSTGEAESTKGRLIVLCLEHLQNSDSGSMTLCSKATSSSQRNSPFREIVGYAAEQLSGSSMCSSPDDASCEGIRSDETDLWHLRLAYQVTWPGMVLAICSYGDCYFLASCGNSFYVCGFPNDTPQRVKKFAIGRTRFMIMSLTAYYPRIVVGDCRDGILFFSYQEDQKKLLQLYSDPSQRLVADCILTDVDTAMVSDRKGSIAVLSCSNLLKNNASPESNLTLSSAYYLGEIALSICKGSFSYKLPADDSLASCCHSLANIDTTNNTIMASTLLGSIMVFIPLSREEYDLLEVVQARLSVHPLTAPILGNDHNEFRSRENPAGMPKILDGDMLIQFLELTNVQQEAVLSLPMGLADITKTSLKPLSLSLNVTQVVLLLERIHYALS